MGAAAGIREVILFLDGDFDHPMETVLWGHPERVPPYMVKRYRILDDEGNVVAKGREVNLSRMVHRKAIQ